LIPRRRTTRIPFNENFPKVFEVERREVANELQQECKRVSVPAAAINGAFYSLRVFAGTVELRCVIYVARFTARGNHPHRSNA